MSIGIFGKERVKGASTFICGGGGEGGIFSFFIDITSNIIIIIVYSDITVILFLEF